jgi:hypothetical protein
MGSCDCSWDSTFLGSDIGLGDHTAVLHVLQGPSGAIDCPASVTIQERTYCSHTISPTTGYPSTTFAWQADSNGTACEWSLDGTLMGSCDCDWEQTFVGSAVGVGTHTAVLHVRQGPSGTAECSASVLVQEETWCNHTVSPSIGGLGTTFAWVASSNGTACEWSLDGTLMGSRGCNWNETFVGSDLGVGNHTAVLHVRQGPTGAKDCAASVTIQ